MFGLIGIAVLLIMVFGGYVLAGGHLGIILKALPFEMIMIGGAAVGSFLISNDLPTVKHTLSDIRKVFKGPRWQTTDYRDLLCLLFELIRTIPSPWKNMLKTLRKAQSSRAIPGFRRITKPST